MNTDLNKIVQALNRKLGDTREISRTELYKAYNLATKLRSQLIGAIYDRERFPGAEEYMSYLLEGKPMRPKLAEMLADGVACDDAVTLTIHEPLPSQKEMTPAIQEHWLELIHTAIAKAERRHRLPCFEKAFVWIEVVTPKGTGNSRLWDTSNRALNLIINNLKGVFFKDDNLEHMAFGAAGKWGEEGVTIVHILSFDRLARFTDCFGDVSS